MFRLNVRRLTAGLLLAALLGLAAPVSAAPAGWSLPATALGAGWVDRVLEWFAHMRVGEAQGRAPVEKSGAPAGTGTSQPSPQADHSGALDPNG